MRSRPLITFLSCCAVLAPSIGAQVSASELARLKSSSDSVRWTALDRLSAMARAAGRTLCSSNSDEQVKSALMAALVIEDDRVYGSARVARAPDISEDEGEYFADLIGCVAALHETRAAPVLARAIATGGGATDGLAALGEAAVSAVIPFIRSKSELERYSAAHTLGKIVTRVGRARLHDSTATAIKKRLIAATADPSVLVRSMAVNSLFQFVNDDDVRAVVSHLATADTGTKMKFGKREYPVRDLATRWLAHDDSVRATAARRSPTP